MIERKKKKKMASTQATNKKGAPTQQAANAFAAQMKASRVAPHTWQSVKRPQHLTDPVLNADQVNDPGENLQAGATNVRMSEMMAYNSTTYPQRPLPLDDRDSDVAILYDLANKQAKGQGGDIDPLITSARPYPVQDWEIEYMKSKAAAEDYAAYQTWLSNKYDLNDMATRAWFKQIAPEYFTQKRALLKELMDRHAKYSYLRMAGPENEEDLRFEYAVETGRIPIPKGPFYNPMEWMVNDLSTVNGQGPRSVAELEEDLQKFNTNAYQYGLFNPVKPRTAAQSGWAGNASNPQDLVGDPASQSYGFLGQTPPVNYDWMTNYGGSTLFNKRFESGYVGMPDKQAIGTKAGGFIPGFSNKGEYAKPATRYNPAPEKPKYSATPQSYTPFSTRGWKPW